jgi:hypothetical protein
MSFVFFLPILPKKQIDELRKSKSTMGRAQAEILHSLRLGAAARGICFGSTSFDEERGCRAAQDLWQPGRLAQVQHSPCVKSCRRMAKIRKSLGRQLHDFSECLLDQGFSGMSHEP